MADSDALRSRRKRAHASGDHHLCKHWPKPAPVLQLAAPDPGDGCDPAAELRKLAGRLVAAHQADPANAALARECRATLQALMGSGAAETDPEIAAMFEAFR